MVSKTLVGGLGEDRIHEAAIYLASQTLRRAHFLHPFADLTKNCHEYPINTSERLHE